MIDYTFPLTVAGRELASERDLLVELQRDAAMEDASSVRFIVIHCTATRPTCDYTPERLLRDHRARGFRTGGYHLYVRRSGEVVRYRRLLEAGAHARGYNRCSVGVCYEGGLDAAGRPADTRTSEQRRVLRELVAELRRLFPDALVVGHRDLPGVSKACPCFNAAAEYRY